MNFTPSFCLLFSLNTFFVNLLFKRNGWQYDACAFTETNANIIFLTVTANDDFISIG